MIASTLSSGSPETSMSIAPVGGSSVASWLSRSDAGMYLCLRLATRSARTAFAACRYTMRASATPLSRRRHAELDRLERRPAAFARVRHHRRDAGERFVVLEDAGAEVEQPGAHDAAVAPGFSEPRGIDVELLARGEQGKALGNGLHHPV